MENTSLVIEAHNKSQEHQTILMWLRDSDSRPDGRVLAAEAARKNNGTMWMQQVNAFKQAENQQAKRMRKK